MEAAHPLFLQKQLLFTIHLVKNIAHCPPSPPLGLPVCLYWSGIRSQGQTKHQGTGVSVQEKREIKDEELARYLEIMCLPRTGLSLACQRKQALVATAISGPKRTGT